MLKVQNVSFGFRHRPLLRDVSLTLAAGELLHLTGPNGAGKSTFMSIVAGLLTPEKGTIEFFPGSEASAAVDDRRRFQEYLPAEANGLYVKMDAMQNLLFWTQLRGLKNNLPAVHAELARWNLDHPLLRDGFPVEKFSTGMKRRLALARLALSPSPLWLLDEPVYGLDAQAVGIFRKLLGDHLAKGGLALLISHDLAAVEGLKLRSLALGAA